MWMGLEVVLFDSSTITGWETLALVGVFIFYYRIGKLFGHQDGFWVGWTIGRLSLLAQLQQDADDGKDSVIDI